MYLRWTYRTSRTRAAGARTAITTQTKREQNFLRDFAAYLVRATSEARSASSALGGSCRQRAAKEHSVGAGAFEGGHVLGMEHRGSRALVHPRGSSETRTHLQHTLREH